MNRNWMTAGIAVVAAALLAVGSLWAEEPKKQDPPRKPPAKEQLKQLQDMMTKLHKGEKSPLARTAAEVKKDSPDWEQLAKDAKGFAGMGAALDEIGHYGRSDYIAGATALVKAVGQKDKEASGKAFASLSKSCSACHYGNPAK
jgi:cytochrome c556